MTSALSSPLEGELEAGESLCPSGLSASILLPGFSKISSLSSALCWAPSCMPLDTVKDSSVHCTLELLHKGPQLMDLTILFVSLHCPFILSAVV